MNERKWTPSRKNQKRAGTISAHPANFDIKGASWELNESDLDYYFALKSEVREGCLRKGDNGAVV